MKKTALIIYSFFSVITLKAQYIGSSGDGGARELFRGTANGPQVASQFGFTIPSPVTPTAYFTVVVEIQDAVGNLAAFSNLASGSVALAIENNPSSGTLSGTNPVSAVDGIATFSGMSINNFGLAYTLKATVSSLSGISSGFDILNMFGGGSADGGASLISPIVTLSGQVFWIGGLGTNPTAWNDPLNWRPNTNVPGSSARLAMEPNNNGHNPILDQNRTIQSINFNGSNKKVELGNNNLTINGELLGTNSDNYFKTNGTGLLIKNISNSESFQFPVGNTYYNPVTITNNNVSSDEFSVKVRDEVLVKGISGKQVTQPHVNTTWDISKSSANTGPGVDFIFQWESSQERNSIATYSLNHFNGTVWDFANSISQSVTGTTTKILDHNGYTGTFSPFAIGENTSVLPINMLEFTAKAKGTSAELRWVTATEDNNDYFGIERSSNGMEWEEIGRIDGAGTTYSSTQYEFTDYKPYDNSYYRLRQVDINGSEEYSEIRMVYFPDPMYLGQMVHAYPNPSNGVISIEPQTQFATSISIYDVTGKLIYQELIKKTTQIDNLSAGVYILKAQVGDRQEMKKIIVQKE